MSCSSDKSLVHEKSRRPGLTRNPHAVTRAKEPSPLQTKRAPYNSLLPNSKLHFPQQRPLSPGFADPRFKCVGCWQSVKGRIHHKSILVLA